MGVEDEKIDIIVFFATGLADVLPVLSNEKLVQLEILADDSFADGGHG
jgi:hypothetical protein